MDINQCCKILDIDSSATNEEISKKFKQLALKYHPDKNPKNTKWANDMMAQLNLAYNTMISSRFQESNPEMMKKYTSKDEYAEFKRKQKEFEEEIYRENLIKIFSRYKDDCKEAIYKYYQYSLYNVARRDEMHNKSIFKDMVIALKVHFHKINQLSQQTEDSELIEHFKVFNNMIFNFYKASECLNILDSYNNHIDVEAHHYYVNADELLNKASKEIYYDRHNRGQFFQADAVNLVLQSKIYFMKVIQDFPESSWVVETNIKLDFLHALLEYIELFFNE